jgi:NAD(P)-dependent dehydrogenase (short-subunit alcohol dehydrogenase family)
MYNPFSLENKTVLITGASSGIGRATAVECSKMGAKCIITARNSDRLNETFNSLEGEGHIQIIADLTNENDIATLVEQLPMLDGFVNSAGITTTKPVQFIKQNDLDNLFAVNTFAPVILTKSIAKKKKFFNGASIVFISSISTSTFAPGNSMYAMTKNAIATFSKYCALEFATKKIRVNSIHPGMVNTEMTQNLIFSKEELELDRQKYPFKRYAEPQEVAWAAIYLLSDAASFISGSELNIDGGVSLI